MYPKRYLKEIGVKNHNPAVPFTTDKSKYKKSRLESYMKEREDYGFDSRETWSLDTTFAFWLYEHIRMYEDRASEIINFKAEGSPRFDVTLWDGTPAKLTQKEAMDVIKEYITAFAVDGGALWLMGDPDFALQFEKDQRTKLQAAAHIWAEILPTMWW